jgi:hypothetical protein
MTVSRARGSGVRGSGKPDPEIGIDVALTDLSLQSREPGS